MHFFIPMNKGKGKRNRLNIILIIICIVFCFGIAVGSKSFVLEENSINEITSLLEKSTDAKKVVSTAFFKNIKTLIWIFIFSFSTIGVPFILYILYEKSVVIGCGICSLISILNNNKFLIILKLIPQFIFNISAIVIVSYFAILFSYNLFKGLFLKKAIRDKSAVSPLVYTIIFLFGIFLCYMSALCEGYIKL